MKNCYCIFFFVIVITISCSNQKKNETNSDHCMVVAINDVDRLSDICLDSIASVKYIPLITPDSDTYLGNIRKIIYKDSCFYLSDGKTIFAYDFNGKYLWTLNQRGKSGAEYLDIYDFEIADKLYILDRTSLKLVSYDLNRNFISSMKIDFYPKSLHSINSSSLLICGENDIIDDEVKMKFHVFDVAKNKIRNSFYPIDIYKGNYLKNFWNLNFIQHNDSLFYFEPHDNRIINIDENGYRDYLKIDFGKNEMPVELYNVNYEDAMKFYDVFHSTTYATGIYWSIWNENNLIFEFLHDKKMKVASCDLKNGTQQISIGMSILNSNKKMEEFFVSNDVLLSYYIKNEEIILVYAVLK